MRQVISPAWLSGAKGIFDPPSFEDGGILLKGVGAC